MSESFSYLPQLIESNGFILNCEAEIEILQKCLSELVRASTCMHNNLLIYECSLPFCSAMKKNLNHMNKCNYEEYECPLKCFNAKILYKHWEKCMNNFCRICLNVRKNHSSENFKQNQVNVIQKPDEILDLTIDSLKEPYYNFVTQPVGHIKSDERKPENSNYFLDRYLNPQNYIAQNNSANTSTNFMTNSNINQYQSTLQLPQQPKVWITSETIDLPPIKKCIKCSYHGEIISYKNHAPCPYKSCTCIKCQKRDARKIKRNAPYTFQVSEVPANLSIDFQAESLSNFKNDVNKIRHEDKADWIQYTNDLDKGFLVEGGKTYRGEISYVGRGYYNGHLIPTAIFPSKNSCNIALFKITLNGKLYHLATCEALIVANFEWKKVEYGRIPLNAVFGGILNDDVQYIGRTFYGQETIIGRVSKESGCLYIPFGAIEVSIQSYEVLVDKNTEDVLIDCSQDVPSESKLKFDSTTESSNKTNKNECTICYESPVVGIFKECMHACLCIDCIDIVNRKREYNGKVACPICRKLSNKAEKFFMA